MSDFFETAARHRGGYLFRSDLLDLGLQDKHIAQAIRAGELDRLRSGTYAPHLREPRSAADRHTLIARSVADKLGPSVALSHHSAALLHTGVVWGVDLNTIHVTRLNGRGGRTEAGITFHVGAVVPDDDLRILDGRQVVCADRAVIESNSLATVEAGMVTTSFALRGDHCTLDQLTDRMRACERWPGMLHVRLAVAKSEPRCESVGEVRSLFLFGAHRVPRPTVQASITNAAGVEVARCDFEWESHRHVGEFDGAVKYGRLNRYEGAELGRAIVDEKRREDDVRSLNYGMSRWMWHDLSNHPEHLAQRVLADLDRSRRLYCRNATIIG